MNFFLGKNMENQPICEIQPLKSSVNPTTKQSYSNSTSSKCLFSTISESVSYSCVEMSRLSIMNSMHINASWKYIKQNGVYPIILIFTLHFLNGVAYSIDSSLGPSIVRSPSVSCICKFLRLSSSWSSSKTLYNSKTS